jgi:toxin ParE1/3/4
MADYVLSNKADSDLTDIYLYSYRAFGEARADAYFLSLGDCLKDLAANPRRGRPVDDLQPGLFCHRHARHIVFYTSCSMWWRRRTFRRPHPARCHGCPAPFRSGRGPRALIPKLETCLDALRAEAGTIARLG